MEGLYNRRIVRTFIIDGSEKFPELIVNSKKTLPTCESD